MPIASPKPRVKVFATGGSIATTARHRLDLAEYPDYGIRLPFEEVLKEIPEVYDFAQIELEQFRNIGSTHSTTQDMLELAQRIQVTCWQDPDLTGVVVTHGTNTIEETAYFLHLTVHTAKPIALVASMRPPHGMSPDAFINFLDAVRTVVSPEAVDKGALVVMNQEINSGREVVKSNTLRVEALVTPHFGLLGSVEANGEVTFYREPFRRHTVHSEFYATDIQDLPRTDIAYSYLGADGTAIAAFAEKGARAIVSAGQGHGMCTQAETAALLEAQKAGILIVQSSRTGSGRVTPSALRVGRDWVSADNLPPSKARILAMVALTKTSNPNEVQRMFNEY
jgi:L-asparaginase